MTKVVNLNTYKLAFHSRLVPALRLIAEQREDSGDTLSDAAEDICETSRIFDCRELPVSLLDEVGARAFEDISRAETPVALPFPDAYFEFADELGIYTSECAHYQGTLTEEVLANDRLPDDAVDLGTTVEFRAFANWSRYPTA